QVVHGCSANGDEVNSHVVEYRSDSRPYSPWE
ncbi:unnamed protein product, partial [marine sediment metagenome]